MTAVMYQETGLTCSSVYGMGLQLAGIILNNLAGDAQHMLFFHMRPMNQPTITGAEFCHKNAGHPCFTEKHVIRYQPLVSVRNAQFHSECYTIDKGSNKTLENNIILILVKEMACLGKRVSMLTFDNNTIWCIKTKRQKKPGETFKEISRSLIE
jgi:hypothetical protein